MPYRTPWDYHASDALVGGNLTVAGGYIYGGVFLTLNDGSTITSISGSGIRFYIGGVAGGNREWNMEADGFNPNVDATHHIGIKNAGLHEIVFKDTTDGHWYEVNVVNGALTLVDLGA